MTFRFGVHTVDYHTAVIVTACDNSICFRSDNMSIFRSGTELLNLRRIWEIVNNRYTISIICRARKIYTSSLQSQKRDILELRILEADNSTRQFCKRYIPYSC